MIRIARSFWLGCRLSGRSTLDILAHEDSKWSQQLFHRQTQPYFKGDNHLFVEKRGPYGEFAKLPSFIDPKITNFHFYGNKFIELLRKEKKPFAKQPPSSDMEKDLLKKFYQIRKSLCQQAFKKMNPVKSSPTQQLAEELSFKSEFLQSMKVYFHLMCKFQKENTILRSLSKRVRDTESVFGWTIIEMIRMQIAENKPKKYIKDLREYLIQQIKKLPQDKYPPQLKDQILSLFELDKGCVVFQSLEQDRMIEGAIKGKINIFNPISSVTSEVFNMIFRGGKNVSIIGSKRIGKSYAMLLAYLLSKYTAEPIFYFSHIRQLSSPQYFAKRVFEYAFMELTKEQIQILAKFSNKNTQSSSNMQFNQLCQIFQKNHPQITVIDQCNYLTTLMKIGQEEQYIHILPIFEEVLRQLDRHTKIVLSSSINVETNLIKRIVAAVKTDSDDQQWRQLLIEQQINDKDNLKQCFKFVLQILIKQKQADNLSFDSKKIQQIIFKSESFQRLIQNVTYKFNGLNYADLKVSAAQIINCILNDQQPTVDTIIDVINNHKLDELIEITKKWLSKPPQKIKKQAQSQSILSESQQNRVKSENKEQKLQQNKEPYPYTRNYIPKKRKEYADYAVFGHGIPNLGYGHQQNYPLHLINSNNKLHRFIEQNYEMFFYKYADIKQYQDNESEDPLLPFLNQCIFAISRMRDADRSDYGPRIEVLFQMSLRFNAKLMSTYISTCFPGLKQKQISLKQIKIPKFTTKTKDSSKSKNQNCSSKQDQIKYKQFYQLKNGDYINYNKKMMEKMKENCLQDQKTNSANVYFYKAAASQKKCDWVFAYQSEASIYFVFTAMGINKGEQAFGQYLTFGRNLIDEVFQTQKKDSESTPKKDSKSKSKIKMCYWAITGNMDFAIIGKKLEKYYSDKQKKSKQQKQKESKESKEAVESLFSKNPKPNTSGFQKIIISHLVEHWPELKEAFRQSYSNMQKSATLTKQFQTYIAPKKIE